MSASCLSFFLYLRLLRRLASLLSQQATLMASNQAFQKQAEGASDAARKYMEENEKLQEVRMHALTGTANSEHKKLTNHIIIIIIYRIKLLFINLPKASCHDVQIG